MTTQRMILVVTLCLSIAAFTGETLSRTMASNRGPLPLLPPPEMLRDLSDEERVKAVEKWHAEREQQEKQRQREHINRMATEAWKRLLGANDQQWSTFEPKIDRVNMAAWPLQAHKFPSRDDAGRLRWKKYSLDESASTTMAPQIAECCRIVDDLIDLLEDEKSTDEQIRQKTDALEKVRADARKELAQIGRELAALPLTPRQEAIFLIMGYIE